MQNPEMRYFALAVGIASLLSFSAKGNEATADELNAVFGIPIWGGGSLWEESAEAVAERLRWPVESRTSRSSSYRLYAKSDVRVLGARPFSLAMQAQGDHPEQISMVFANKGDVMDLIPRDELERLGSRAQTEAAKIYKKYIKQDSETIEGKLKEVLGEPVRDRFGQGQQTREQVKRWDWGDSSILLAAPRDEYVAVRIVPKSVADGAVGGRISDAELRAALQEKITRRDNGDVILEDIPMVNQGPKGYCVPATWERAMRYVGIPADMYVLAMAGNTNVGGGTSTREIAAGASEIIRRNGRRVTPQGGRLRVEDVARTIDKGLPLLWAMFVVDEVNDQVTARSRVRKSVTDWEQWKRDLDPVRKAARNINAREGGGHVCMIIGYNKDTREIAVSDSWGPQFAERWMTEEEVAAVSQGECSVISW